jgi:hypothetical protein
VVRHCRGRGRAGLCGVAGVEVGSCFLVSMGLAGWLLDRQAVAVVREGMFIGCM